MIFVISVARFPTTINTFRRRRFPAHFGALLDQNRLARQLDAVAFHRQHLHQNLIAFVQLIAHIANPMLRHFADMQQPIQARQNLDKRSEVRQPRHGTKIRLPNFRRSAQVANNLQRPRRLLLIAGRNIDLAGVFDINLDPCLFNDAANHLPARPNQIANLVGGNLHSVEARRMRRNFLASRSQNFFHLPQNMQPSGLCLFHGLAHDLRRNTLDLNIHLHGRDPLAGTSHLEIHIAVVIFSSGNVGEDGISIAFLHQPHRHTSHRRFQRHTSIHQ